MKMLRGAPDCIPGLRMEDKGGEHRCAPFEEEVVLLAPTWGPNSAKGGGVLPLPNINYLVVMFEWDRTPRT
ncbi:hypothetical protein NDU88_005056 [Pleurodeles waltl]|uniref:Uncharacterized protein n=1 Tax=Pleurodeles waltl TaxID=8319 RepID=A0AAV7UIG6_PLEWA|nr:hypothetical protein NDU88_005056 [Pleurodeles waltl]